MNKLVLALVACLGMTGCLVAPAYGQEVVQPQIQNGCAIVEDTYGEREVCNTNYYVYNGSVVYWDPYFGIWAGNGFYNYNGGWYRGYYPGYYGRYGSYYHGQGYYHGYSHGYYHGNGGSHGYGGGSYHGGGGSYHGGGGSFHGGGHSGGHGGGHR